MDWIYMKHPDVKGVVRVPNNPAAVGSHEARGWETTEPPKEGVFVPRTTAPSGDEWVQMWHPKSGGAQRLPNNPDAIEEAQRNGWTDKPPAPKAQDKRSKE